jgi:hypothetical protein
MNFFQNMLSSIMKSRLAFSRSGAEDFGFFHKEINQSYGIMVNYLYDLDVVEENHELFFKTKEVVLSNEMKSFKKKNS